MENIEWKPLFIDGEQFCRGIEYTRVNADKPPRYLLKPLKQTVGKGGGIRAGTKPNPNKKTAGSTATLKPADKKTMLLDLGDMGQVPITLGNMMSPFKTNTPSTGFIESV